ncbi:MAG: hypothetical protein ACTSUF_10185 [Candidatus Heimdallarchaeaceae archaeon]
MTEALQNKLIEVLDLGKVGILNVFEAIKAQVPELVEQILKYTFLKSFIGWLFGIFCLIVFVFCAKGLMLVYKRERERAEKLGEKYIGYTYESAIKNIIYGVVGITTFITGISTFFDYTLWLEILIAPKLFIVEYIAELIK